MIATPRWSLALAALLAAALLSKWSPEGLSDGLRQTLITLPVVVFVFAELARSIRRNGGRSLPALRRRTYLAALGALASLTALQGGLRLPLGEEVLYAGFLLLLASLVADLLLAARPVLGRRLPTRPPALFFWIPFAVYLALLPWSMDRHMPDGDEPFYLLITHSLAYDFDAELTNNYADGHWRSFMDRPIEPQSGDPRGADGEIYSRHNELLPMALALPYRLAGKTGALAMMAAMTALLAWLVLRLAYRYRPERPGGALLGYGLFAFTPPLVLFSTQVWAEVPAALLAMLALDRILALGARIRSHASHASTGATWDGRAWLGIGLPLILLPLLKIRFMLLAAPLLILAWWYARRPWRPLLILCASLGLVGAGILAYNSAHYGNPLKIHSMEELALHERSLADYLEGGFGLFFDTAFGLFASAPIWLIALPAVLWLARRRRPVLKDLAVFALPYLLVVAPRGEWYGGWSPPFRYGLFILPLLSLGVGEFLETRRRWGARALLAGLGLATLGLGLLWLTVPGWTYNFADGRTYLLDHASRFLGADVARFFPSTIRPRLAAWIWPPAALLAVSLLWWWRGRRRGQRSLAGPRQIAALGLLGLAALLPFAAQRLPTRVAEIEDPWITKTRGHIYPSRWIIERTRYPGGWMLRPGESARIPVRPGGEEVTLTLSTHFVRNSDWPIFLRIKAGDRILQRWRPTEPKTWRETELGPFEWQEGEDLILEVAAREPRGKRRINGLLVDRVEFRWLP